MVESYTKGGDEELVIVIAGGMTSQLTYDGIDVCASRVAWEVRVPLCWGYTHLCQPVADARLTRRLSS